MAENKTRPRTASVQEFIDGLDNPKRQSDARALLTMMSEVSGEEPIMWGPSIIGFGQQHYVYESGREGDTPLIAFSPRKAHLVLYLSNNLEANQGLFEQLGKHKTSVACLYINKLADVDLTVLRQLIENSYHAENTNF